MTGLRERIKSAIERFEKWHKSWRSYKEPKHITVNDPLSKMIARQQEKARKKRDWLQDPEPEYLHDDKES